MNEKLILGIIRIWKWASTTLEKINTTQVPPIPAPPPHTRPSLPSTRPSPSSSSALSLNLRTTEQSNALQLLQFRESILYAFLNYLRHEVELHNPTATSSQPTRAGSAHSLFRGPGLDARTCWRNVRPRSRLFRFRRLAVGQGPLALAAAVSPWRLTVGLQRAPPPFAGGLERTGVEGWG